MIGADGPSTTDTATLLAAKTGQPYHRGMISVLEELETTAEPEPRVRWKFLKTAFDQTIVENHAHSNGVFDRTLLDHLARCLLNSNGKISDSVCKSMCLLTKENLAKYDRVFYLPFHGTALLETETDGGGKAATTLALDLMTKALLELLDVKTVTVTAETPADRVDLIVNHLGKESGGRDVG